MFPDPVFLLSFLPVLLFSLTFHEAAHAWMSNRLGDPTARMLGRLTLNPIAHLDVFGTLMLVFSGFRFGWAKPVPFDPRNLSDPRRGMFLIAAAGPASNVILAIGCGLVVRLMIGAGWGTEIQDGFTHAVGKIFAMGVIMNLSLAFFNLIPLPPLDGSKILMGLAPPTWDRALYSLERVGPMILIGLILMGFVVGFSPIWLFMRPFVSTLSFAFTGVPLNILWALAYA
ncbi:MAG: site-2 protease family protein [Candidatus Zixiibacteriota bacterium]